MKHSLQSFRQATSVSVIGGAAYLSNRSMSPARYGALTKALRNAKWFEDLVKDFPAMRIHPEAGWHCGLMALEYLKLISERTGFYSYSYNEDRFAGIRPQNEAGWMKNLPCDAQYELRLSRALTGGLDPLAIVPSIPYMGFGYIFPDDGLESEACNVFNLHRLRNVRQLSFLRDSYGMAHDRGIMANTFHHTRYLHSLDVCAVANLIARNIFAKNDARFNTLSTAAISHDALTPAGGDAVKLIDPDAFDEDANYPELLTGPGWEMFRRKYDIDQPLLVATVFGQGLLGQILDASDKSAYTARDVFAYLAPGQSWNKRDEYFDGEYANLQRIVDRDPHVCAIWESARVVSGKLVFLDKERLRRFLTLRALMFRGLYYNPYSRFFEYLVGKGAVKYLYSEGFVGRSELLSKGDMWIEEVIENLLGSPYLLALHHLERSRIEEFNDYGSACRRMEDLDHDDSILVIFDDFKPITGCGTKKFLVKDRGQVKTFEQACPAGAEEIQRILQIQPKFRLYIFEFSDLNIQTTSRKWVKSLLRSVA